MLIKMLTDMLIVEVRVIAGVKIRIIATIAALKTIKSFMSIIQRTFTKRVKMERTLTKLRLNGSRNGGRRNNKIDSMIIINRLIRNNRNQVMILTIEMLTGMLVLMEKNKKNTKRQRMRKRRIIKSFTMILKILNFTKKTLKAMNPILSLKKRKLMKTCMKNGRSKEK
jgi:hypothetical protein